MTTSEQSRIEIDGRIRTFTVVGEPGKESDRSLILVFHGSRQNAASHRAFTGGSFDALTDRGAVVAYLDGYRGNWNDARRQSSFPARRDGIDDVAFTSAVIELLHRTHGVDRQRAFAVGYSNGGQFVMRLLHEPSAPLAGAAVIAATLPTPESFLLPQSATTAHPVPVTIVHGTADPIVPYRGGRMSPIMRALFRVGGNAFSAPDTAAYFARRNGIGTAPHTTALPSNHADGTRLERSEWTQSDRPTVTLLTVHDGGHTVPGPGRQPRLLGRIARGVSVADLVGRMLDGPAVGA